MADRFYKDIELPDLAVGVSLPAPDSGFIEIYGRGGNLAVTNSQGEETVLMNRTEVFIGEPSPLPGHAALVFVPKTIQGQQVYEIQVNVP